LGGKRGSAARRASVEIPKKKNRGEMPGRTGDVGEKTRPHMITELRLRRIIWKVGNDLSKKRGKGRSFTGSRNAGERAQRPFGAFANRKSSNGRSGGV